MANKPNPQRGEFWLLDLDPTTGHEQKGKRPCLIVSNNQMNSSLLDMVIVVPITSTPTGYPTHIKILARDSGLNNDSFVMCEQTRAVSKERFGNRIGNRAPVAVMKAVEIVIKNLMSL